MAGPKTGLAVLGGFGVAGIGSYAVSKAVFDKEPMSFGGAGAALAGGAVGGLLASMAAGKLLPHAGAGAIGFSGNRWQTLASTGLTIAGVVIGAALVGNLVD